MEPERAVRCRSRGFGISMGTLPEGAVDFVNESWVEFMGLSPKDALAWN